MKSTVSVLPIQESLLRLSMNVGVHKSLNLCPMISILYISSTAATISMVLPHENVDGNPVPTLFKDRPPDYHMFLMFILFAFLGAFSALMLQHKPRVGKIFRISAIASMLSAFATVFNAAALWFVGPLLAHIN
ncbi:hypothetical protein SO802_022150 [Lithocarpus litseifolius]|uniref:PIN-like protein n=1 Tax=Lithocarpus litseifolius TaxID=425828 RepID=A0AAW2CGV0_9ROSI